MHYGEEEGRRIRRNNYGLVCSSTFVKRGSKFTIKLLSAAHFLMTQTPYIAGICGQTNVITRACKVLLGTE